MDWKPIEKSNPHWRVPPNLLNYDEVRRTFSWSALEQELHASSLSQGLNIADIAIDRHTTGSRANQTALRFIDKEWNVQDFTYRDLKELTNRFANVLHQLSVGKGDRVFVLAGRIPALYIAALGTLKNGSVFCPMFSAFGPEPVFQRMDRGDAKVLVTTQVLYSQKVAQLRDRLPNLQHILLIDAEEHAGDGVWSLAQLVAKASPEYAIAPTDPEDMALLHFTSGTTGMPKGAIHVHKAVYQHYIPLWSL